MIAHRAGLWVLVAATTLFLASAPALATAAGSARSPETERTSSALGSDKPQTEHVPAGNPIFGVLILIGVVAFLIFVAWLFSRIGEGGGRSSDNTMN